MARIAVTAANGMTVWIEEEAYESWRKAQAELKSGKRKVNEQLVKELREEIRRRAARSKRQG